MQHDKYENILGHVIGDLVYELRLSSLSNLWDEAEQTTSRATWYKRIDPDQRKRVPTRKEHIDKLIKGLERNGHQISQELKNRLYAAIGIEIPWHTPERISRSE